MGNKGKIVLIENEYVVPEEIQKLQKNHPLFNSMIYEIGCLSRSMESILPTIKECDGLMVISTWMYKDQLYQFVEAFASGVLPENYNIYVWRLKDALNDWMDKSSRYLFYDYDKFMEYLKTTIEKYNVFDVREDLGREGKYFITRITKIDQDEN